LCSLRSRRYEESAWPVEKAQELDESILAAKDELAQIAADTARAAAAAVKLEAEPMNRALGELVGAAEAESTALAEKVASRRGANALRSIRSS
jgi:DNA-directed RNA polymerase subunit F